MSSQERIKRSQRATGEFQSSIKFTNENMTGVVLAIYWKSHSSWAPRGKPGHLSYFHTFNFQKSRQNGFSTSQPRSSIDKQSANPWNSLIHHAIIVIFWSTPRNPRERCTGRKESGWRIPAPNQGCLHCASQWWESWNRIKGWKVSSKCADGHWAPNQRPTKGIITQTRSEVRISDSFPSNLKPFPEIIS